MHTTLPQLLSTRRFASRAGATLSLVALCATTAFAATPSASASIEARYQLERSKCLDGSSSQDRPTCLKEAGAARDAARRGQLDDADARYRRNAKARCDALTGDDARDCLDRMKGKGTTSGSVDGGGILRETVTREVKPADPAPAPAPAPASN